jgi:hypothetical protein
LKSCVEFSGRTPSVVTKAFIFASVSSSKYFKSRLDRFLPDPFQLISHWSFYQP